MKYIKCISNSIEGLTIDKIYEVKSSNEVYSKVRLSIIDDNNRERFFQIMSDKLFIDAKLEGRNIVIDEILL